MIPTTCSTVCPIFCARRLRHLPNPNHQQTLFRCRLSKLPQWKKKLPHNRRLKLQSPKLRRPPDVTLEIVSPDQPSEAADPVEPAPAVELEIITPTPIEPKAEPQEAPAPVAEPVEKPVVEATPEVAPQEAPIEIPILELPKVEEPVEKPVVEATPEVAPQEAPIEVPILELPKVEEPVLEVETAPAPVVPPEPLPSSDPEEELLDTPLPSESPFAPPPSPEVPHAPLGGSHWRKGWSAENLLRIHCRLALSFCSGLCQVS